MKQIIMFVAIKSLSINIGDIMYTRMLQKSVRPTEIEMIEYTKSRKEYFNELIYIIEYLKQYDLLYEINFPYRNSYGWDFSYYQKKKMICILFPKDKHNLS